MAAKMHPAAAVRKGIRMSRIVAAFSFAALFTAPLAAQSISSGTVTGSVLDPSQMSIPKASVELRNQVTGYTQTTETDENGAFRFNNVPPQMYEIVVTASGFATRRQPLEVSNPVPINLTFTLQMAEVSTTVEVVRGVIADRHRSIGPHRHQLRYL